RRTSDSRLPAKKIEVVKADCLGSEPANQANHEARGKSQSHAKRFGHVGQRARLHQSQAAVPPLDFRRILARPGKTGGDLPANKVLIAAIQSLARRRIKGDRGTGEVARDSPECRLYVALL